MSELGSKKGVLSMLLVQIFATVMQVLSRVILVEGTFIFALTFYRHLVAAISIAPFAFYFERGEPKPFNWKVWFWLFINALTGMTMALALFYFGLRDTSATYSVNFLNLIPICTFLTCIIFRLEELRLQTWVGKAKTIGAILCVGGALTTSLYKGKEFYLGTHHAKSTVVVAHKTHMLQGTFFLLASCFSYTAWFIVQVQLQKVFPLRYFGTMLACVIAAIQSAIIGVIVDSSKAAWRLEWNLQLITILYSGALASGATFCLISWAISVKGPTYPPMFNPLTLIFVALSEAIILGEPLRVGMLLGTVLIIVGLYSFLWGEKNEKKNRAESNAAAAEVPTRMTGEPVRGQSTLPTNPVAFEIKEIDQN
ncbi:hypothetical protein RJT34_11868 [Clitoria ternatea]|uniref:WAT1-related protein n=1 Tax=Clitoria ternatea TaxID=43366 RepID=A0AAN9JL79_CLITE